jgi:hypothetical protein
MEPYRVLLQSYASYILKGWSPGTGRTDDWYRWRLMYRRDSTINPLKSRAIKFEDSDLHIPLY